jgi:hypothetical protein
MILRYIGVALALFISLVCVANFLGALPDLPFIYGFEYLFYLVFLGILCLQPKQVKELSSVHKKNIALGIVVLFVVLRVLWPFVSWNPDMKTAQQQYEMQYTEVVSESSAVEKQSRWDQTLQLFGEAFEDLWVYQQIVLIALDNEFNLETPTVALKVDNIVGAKKHVADVKASVTRINNIDEKEAGALPVVDSATLDKALKLVSIYEDDTVDRNLYNISLKEHYGNAQYEYDYFINANRANLSKYVGVDNKDYFKGYIDTDLVLAVLTMQEQVEAPIIAIANSGFGVVGEFIYRYIAWVMFFATGFLSLITAYYIMTVKSDIRVTEE